jgi:hypothetical protein
MKAPFFGIVVAALFLCSLFTALAAKEKPKNSQVAEPPPGAPTQGYLTSWSAVLKMSKDMYGALKPDQKKRVNSEPISLETDVTPFIKLEVYPDDKGPLALVFISVGFVDLVNNLAHAKAIDKIEKGYFQRYIGILAQESGQRELAPLPNIQNPKYWSEDMMNEQLSNFNSIVGLIVGVNMAHHYLGQFAKYEKKIIDAGGNNSVPINSALTPEEYDLAFRQGLKNALNGGCTIEGVIPFFEAFDKMPVRPPWATYFLPNTVKFSKLKKTLEKIQADFFAGKSE